VKEISDDPDQFLTVGRTNTSHISDFRKSGVKEANVGANIFKTVQPAWIPICCCSHSVHVKKENEKRKRQHG